MIVTTSNYTLCHFFFNKIIFNFFYSHYTLNQLAPKYYPHVTAIMNTLQTCFYKVSTVLHNSKKHMG